MDIEVPQPVDQSLEILPPSVSEDEPFDPFTGEPLPTVDLTSCPMPLPSTTFEGGLKNRKMKGGVLFQTDASKDKLIDVYLAITKGLENINDFEVFNKGTRITYGKLSEADKIRYLKNFTVIIHRFIALFNSCSDYVKQRVSSKGLAGGRRNQKGGADDFTFSKIYNTQGLIIDNNDPIVKASSYINTADQIPQPFSSASSGATYSSGLEPAFLQDVLPVLNMAGGVKQKLKSKRDRK